MARQSREEIMRIAQERLRRQKEEEEKKEAAYFQKITTGWRWLAFKIVAFFCTAVFLITTIDSLVDGPMEPISENEWKIDRQLYMRGHQSIKVNSALFVADFRTWNGHIDDSFKIVYSPILRTEKKLVYTQDLGDGNTAVHSEIRRRSIFTWFPFLQILMIIPLLTYLFKSRKAWFTFARGASFFLIGPATLLILIFTLI